MKNLRLFQLSKIIALINGQVYFRKCLHELRVVDVVDGYFLSVEVVFEPIDDCTITPRFLIARIVGRQKFL